MLKLIFALGISALTTFGAVAQTVDGEVDPVPATNYAETLGYELFHTENFFNTPERELVDEMFMAKIAETFAPGERYGFGFRWIDVTGDGEDDLVLFPKIPSMFPPDGFDFSAAPIFVYVKDSEGVWRLELEAGTISLGVKDSERYPGGKDLALIQQVSIFEYSWDGNDFILIKETPVPLI